MYNRIGFSTFPVSSVAVRVQLIIVYSYVWFDNFEYIGNMQ